MNISSSHKHAEVIARFYLRKDPHGDPLHKRLVNLPSILSRNKTKQKKSVPSTPIKSPHNHTIVSHRPLLHTEKHATINRLQTVDPKKLSARIYLQTVRLGEGKRCRGEEESAACERPRLCCDSKSVVLSHRACVRVCVCLGVFEVQKSLSLSPSLSRSLPLSHLLQTPPLPNSSPQRSSVDALRWRMRFTFPLKYPTIFFLLFPLVTSSGESRNLSVGKTGKRERRAEPTVTKQASLLPKINL